MSQAQALVLHYSEVPDSSDPLHREWLHQQPYPVIAWGGEYDCVQAADTVVPDEAAAQALVERIDSAPKTAMTLVQVLRATEQLPVELGLNVESLAYSTLQAGPEFNHWKNTFEAPPWPEDSGPAVLMERSDTILQLTLNRPKLRNSITIELRDALIEALELAQLDDSIERVELRGKGACFSVGGELREFGSFVDQSTAHWVRSVHSPARMLHRVSHKLTSYVHGACLGSGMELPAFAQRVVAHPKTFFQLPELQLGLIPGAGGTVSLTRRIGRQRMAWLVLSGKRINAKTALAWGLVDAIES